MKTKNHPESIEELKTIARRVRLIVVETAFQIGLERKPHPGPALSIVDILVVLYNSVLTVEPHNPQWPERDRFVISKGHGYLALYAVLAIKGYFPESDLLSVRYPGSILQGHPSMSDTPGVDMTTGSLGNGLGAAVGMAVGGKMDRMNFHVFSLLGDGELNEGVVWEAAQFAAKYRLNNLTAIIDWNRYQSCGSCEDIMPPGNMEAKWRAFGWDTERIDGHDIEQINSSLSKAKERHSDRPKVFIAQTVKGKGVSFMENNNEWHQKGLKEEEWEVASRELWGPS
jgi:transketolase